MNLGGLQPCSFSDYPGKTAAVVFTQGCNFCCPFCHNVSLLSRKKKGHLKEQECFHFLEKRVRHLDAVVISGGEPTIQRDLPEFIRAIRELGYLIKVDSNGSQPSMLTELLNDGLVDYVAMDIKAPLEKYDLLAGTVVKKNMLSKSMDIIATSGVPHHFRTTDVRSLLSQSDRDRICNLVPSGSPHLFQPFVEENAVLMEKCSERS